MIDLIDMRAYFYEGAGRGNAVEGEIPPEEAEQAQTYRERLMEEVAEGSDELLERYLEGDEICYEEIVEALKSGTNHGSIFPVVCGVAPRNLGTNRLLESIVDDLPSPVEHGAFETAEITLEPDAAGELFSYVFKTRADPFAGRINLLRVFQGTLVHDSSLLNTRTHAKERVGQLLTFAGKGTGTADEFGPGDIGGVAKLKDTRAGDWLAARDEPIRMPVEKLPAPVMAFAIEPKTKGDEDKVFTSLRRLQEEDPTIDLHRDAQTGEQIVAGLSQIHVEVIVERLRTRFGAEVNLKPPRVPYQETIRAPAKAHGRHKKQSGGRGQFGDCHIEIQPLEDGDFEFVNHIKGGAIPGSFIPAVEKGVREAMDHGVLAGYPVKGVRVHASSTRRVSIPWTPPSSPSKLAGSHAMKEALEQASPVLLEPIMAGHALGSGGERRGRDRRPERPPRPPAGHGAERRDDRDQGRGADGGDARLRPRPALDHRRPGRLHDGVPALRGGPRPSRRSRARGRDRGARAGVEAAGARGRRDVREHRGRSACRRHPGCAHRIFTSAAARLRMIRGEPVCWRQTFGPPATGSVDEWSSVQPSRLRRGRGRSSGALPIVVGDLGMTLSPGAAFSADATAQPV